MRKLRDIINNYYVADARRIGRILPQVPCVDVTITSPPYWNLKNYGCRRQIGFGQSYEEYLDDISHIFNVVYERTRHSGSLWIVSDTLKCEGRVRLLPFDIARRLQEIGWILQDIIIWEKDKTLPWSHQGKLRNIFEYVTFFTKSQRFKYEVAAVRDAVDIKPYWVRYPERYSPTGKAPARKWKFSIPLQGSWAGSNGYLRHVCPLPPALIERILRLTTDKEDVVLDPFAGSGSVLATAKAMGRAYVGIDLSRADKTWFRKRVLPGLLKDFTLRNGEALKKKSTQRRFSAFVKGLRRLKFPKEVLRLYQRKRKPPSCLGVFALPERNSDNLRVLFVFPNKKSIPKTFEEQAVQLSLSPPLSKYGIRPTFGVLTRRQLTLQNSGRVCLKASTSLYVYQQGRFYSWEAQTTLGKLSEFLAERQKGKFMRTQYPPIISTIRLRVDPRNPALGLEGKHGERSKEE